LTRENIFEAFDKRIARVVGMQDYQAERDGHFFHDPVSLHPTYATFLSARDLARFGLLYLNGCIWAGKQVVPPSKRLVVAHTADRTDSLFEFRSSHIIELLRLIVDAGPGSR
jgi:CubicO group peptidase (beta-lactamase class C family)